jgi:hypothetical protein
MTFSKRTLAALVAVAGLSLGASNAQADVKLDFSVNPAVGNTITYTGATASVATSINLTNSSFTVQSVAADDTTGTTAGTAMTIVPTAWSTAVGSTITKSWTAAGVNYTETLSVANTSSSNVNTLNIIYAGKLIGTNGVNQNAFMIANLNQAQGPPNGAVALSLTETSTPPAGLVPEPSTLALAGLGTLGFVAYGLRRRKARTA